MYLPDTFYQMFLVDATRQLTWAGYVQKPVGLFIEY